MAVVVTQLVVDASGAKTGVAEFESAMQKAKASALDTGDATAKSFDRVQAQWTNSLAKTDPLIKASIAQQKEMSRQQEINSNAVKLGITTQAAADAQIVKLTQQHQAYTAQLTGATKATTELAAAHKGLDAQGQAAFHSIRSGVEQLAMGVPITQALTGQINHLTFAASGQGGLAGAFGQVGGIISSLISPTTAVIAVTAALAAGAAYLALQYDRVQVSSQRAIGGAGGRTGTTVTDLNNFTTQNSRLLSNTEARGLGEGLTSTGDIEVRRLHDMNDAIVGFSNQTKRSIGEATKAFVQFGVDPQKGVQELTAAFGPLDENTRKLVESFTLIGDKTSALNVLIDATAEKSKKAADNMGFWERVNRNITKFQGQEISKPVGIEDQLNDARDRLNTALDTGMTSNDIKSLSKEFADLQEKREAAIGQAATDNFNKLNSDAERHRIEVAAIKEAWGGVGTDTALALQAMQNQLPVASALTEAAKMRAQQELTFVTLKERGVKPEEASLLAAKQYEVSQAAAQASAAKTVKSSEDNLDAIKAEGTGMEGVVAANKAYQALLDAGGTSLQANIVYTNTLAASTLKAANAAQQLADNESRARDAAMSAALQNDAGAAFGPTSGEGGIPGGSSTVGKGLASTSNIGVSILNAYNSVRGSGGTSSSNIADATIGSGLDAAIAAVQAQPYGTGAPITGNGLVNFSKYGLPSIQNNVNESDTLSTVQSLYGLKNSQTTDKNVQASNLNAELAWLNSRPETIARDQAIASLKQSIDQLNTSTSALNSTNQELLSPYYAADPRTSHIGFRSQGMATGGEFTVPGGYSANDNMLGTIPLASGEIVSVRRPGQGNGSSQNINITQHITVGAGADKNEFGRTAYQATQNALRQFKAAS